MPHVPKPVLQKTIFEIRYEPQLRFYDLLITAAQEMAEYPNWETDRLSVTRKDFDKRCSVTISHNSIGYEQDSPDEDLEAERIQGVLAKLLSSLEITSLTRMGYRRQYLLAADMPFDSLVAVMNVKFFSQDETLRAALPPQVTDVMYRIDSRRSEYSYHITGGPVRRQETPRWLVYNRAHHLKPSTAEQDYRNIVNSYPEVAFFLDIDMYRQAEPVDSSIASSFVDHARSDLSSMAAKLAEYLFATKPEV